MNHRNKNCSNSIYRDIIGEFIDFSVKKNYLSITKVSPKSTKWEKKEKNHQKFLHRESVLSIICWVSSVMLSRDGGDQGGVEFLTHVAHLTSTISNCNQKIKSCSVYDRLDLECK